MTLPDGCVRLHRLNLDRKANFETLSDDERARADRFHFPIDRDRFAVGRASLRALLGGYLDIPPSALRFGYSKSGKPFLQNNPALRFNLSHSRETGLLAVSYNREVGIDLEFIDPGIKRDWESVALEVFSKNERIELVRSSPEEKIRMFYRLWTRKEAYVKGLGVGLLAPLSEICTVTNEGMPGWTVISLDDPRLTGFAAALAIEGATPHVENGEDILSA